MDALLILEQALNGVQLGVMLFLMAAGITLVLGIMNLVNLTHGSLYMLGAYFAATFLQLTGSFLLAIVLGLAGSIALGFVIEFIAFRALYARDHLDQVLATFGLILFFNEITSIIWGADPYYLSVPSFLSGTVEILPGVPYPAYRLAITAVGLAVGALLYFVIARTRLGMLIRAGASNRELVGALGVDITTLFAIVFALGAAMAGLAGMMVGPILSVEVGMGEPILILTFVVIVIGGIGSVRGAFVGSILVGLVDTFGRLLLPQFLGYTAGPAVSSMSIYLFMALVLIFRPQGLFPARG